MKRQRAFAAFLTVLFAAIACNLPGGTASPTSTVPPSITPMPTDTPAVPTVSPLTADMLKNGTYKLPQLGATVTLVNGKYDSPAADENVIHVALLDPIAFGDLNGDGAEDAAVLFSENSGGTGDFISVVVVLNQNGAPMQSADRLIDDRAMINGMTIHNGRILVDAVIHGPADPMCCPNFPAMETLQLRNNRLILTHFTSTFGGPLREILLTSPAAGATVSGSIPVAGSVTIAPFENTLNASIFDLGGNKLSSGPIMVASGGMGEPGTFASAIDVSAIPAGTVVRLEVSDLSAADGSLLAMDSVECTVE
jgi:hypothetical protein